MEIGKRTAWPGNPYCSIPQTQMFGKSQYNWHTLYSPFLSQKQKAHPIIRIWFQNHLAWYIAIRSRTKTVLLSAKAVSNNRNPKYKTYLSFRYRYSQRVPYLFLIFSNNKTQKTILSANGSYGERILIFGLWISWHPKWIFQIGTLLEAIGILLKTYFGFGYPQWIPCWRQPEWIMFQSQKCFL
jgi:hypothetical protein